jgi:hypothetical protein
LGAIRKVGLEPRDTGGAKTKKMELRKKKRVVNRIKRL